MINRVKLKFSFERYNVEGYKDIPSWVCSNLITFGNCAVSDDTLNKFGGLKQLEEWGCKCRIVEKPSGKVIEVI